MEMMSGSQINSFLSATSLVWASSIVLLMVGLVYVLKYRERHDSSENSHFLVIYIFTLVLNILEFVMNFEMEKDPSYDTFVYKSYILVGFFWNISIIFYVLNYVNSDNSSGSKALRAIMIILIILSFLCCIFLDIDATLESNGKFYILNGDLNSVYNLFTIMSNLILIIIILWFRKSMPKGFCLLCILTFLMYIGLLIFKNVTGYIVKETVFIYTLYILIIFNTTSNQDKESVHKLNEIKTTLAHINDKRNRIINKISYQMGESLNNLVLYNDDLYLSKDYNRLMIQSESIKIDKTTSELIDYLNNIKDISRIEANYNPRYEQYKLNTLTNYINDQIGSLANSKNINFNITVEDDTFLNYIGDVKKIEKAILNILLNSIYYTKEGEFVTLNLASRQYDLKNVELIVTIQDGSSTTNVNMAKANLYDFIDTDRKFNKYDLMMIISNKLLEILKSKMDVKIEQNSTVYSFSIIQGFKDKELYSSIK